MNNYYLTVKGWDIDHTNRDKALIVATFKKYIRLKGLDAFESRLDVACLEIAEKLGYVYERLDENELVFIQRGLQ